jgi:cholesterol 7-dehydrogenase
MIRFRKTVIAIVLIVAASATPLFGNILELPEYFYGFAAGVINFESSRNVFIHAYSYARYLLQCFTLQLLAGVSVVVYALKRLWSFLFSPLDYKCNLADVGYLSGGLSKRETANQVRKRRKIGEIPPVFPNGWFFVISSAELPIKGVKYVQILGEHLAVFRGEDGVAYILDAYCPHLGANIAVGGQVKGSCIQCPFHGWRFEGDSGACVEVPYSKGVPEFAKTKSWNTIEKNNRIYIWYHAEGAEPDWFPEDLEEVQNGTWRYCGQTVHHINCHIEVGNITVLYRSGFQESDLYGSKLWLIIMLII